MNKNMLSTMQRRPSYLPNSNLLNNRLDFMYKCYLLDQLVYPLCQKKKYNVHIQIIYTIHITLKEANLKKFGISKSITMLTMHVDIYSLQYIKNIQEFLYFFYDRYGRRGITILKVIQRNGFISSSSEIEPRYSSMLYNIASMYLSGSTNKKEKKNIWSVV
jgi:hypothetical protein